jgi:cystathionine gamma-synthase
VPEHDSSAPAHQGFATRAIHDGQAPDPLTGAVTVPIHPSSTFAQDGVGGTRSGYEYARSGNPTRRALEVCLASLEGGARGIAFASGLAAEDAIVRTLCRPGSHVVVPDDAYGGTFRLLARVHGEWGVEVTPVALNDIAAVTAAVRPGSTTIVWVETPTNPLLGVADIAAIAQVAHRAGAVLVVDNTFASPYLQQPIALGADVVIHSTTKYAGGHSDVVGGAVVTAADDLGERIAYLQNAAGAVPGPFDCWLVLRGLRTLALRMERHSDNAAAIARLLAAEPAVNRVHYPGLSTDPGHEIASRQMRRFGGMVSFQLEAGPAAAAAFCAATRVFTLAESLGGVESLVEQPAAMTHVSVAGSPLEVPGNLVRLSVGIEDIADLLADVERGLVAARAVEPAVHDRSSDHLTR